MDRYAIFVKKDDYKKLKNTLGDIFRKRETCSVKKFKELLNTYIVGGKLIIYKSDELHGWDILWYEMYVLAYDPNVYTVTIKVQKPKQIFKEEES